MASSVTDGPPRLTETTSLRAERTNTLDAGPLKPYELPISTRRMGLETPLREDYKVPKLWLKGDRPQPRASSRAILVNGGARHAASPRNSLRTEYHTASWRPARGCQHDGNGYKNNIASKMTDRPRSPPLPCTKPIGACSRSLGRSSSTLSSSA
ncbi:hypothetical protein LY78DRAFT_148115 [Colletotrichum sublineola]|nr:hypothetical protein LY78DRAFT_148115 [Colletotrichum sublineola]